MKSKSISILFIGLTVFVLIIYSPLACASGGNPDASALSLTNPFDFFKNNLNLLKNAAQNTGISTTVPNLQLLDTKNLSFSDIPGSLKAIGVLAINLFLIVIQTVAGILKALLPFLSK